jgi:S1-C subfamily serine protease
MDIERLSKVQIVLLTLLISFVTSIATGIVTVSLMDQAPPSVEQTVNRVIERTVQTVVPGQPAAVAVTQEKTVVVKESDLISQSVAKVSPSVVRLYSSSTDSPSFLGLGLVLDTSGTIVTDTDVLGDSADAVAQLSSGARIRTFVSSRDTATGIARMKSATTTVDAKVPVWTPVTISGEHSTLGDTVIVLSGSTVSRIESGIITSLIPATANVPQIIDTDIAATAITDGSPLIDTGGNLVGVSTKVARASSASGFVPASVLTAPITSDSAHEKAPN